MKDKSIYSYLKCQIFQTSKFVTDKSQLFFISEREIQENNWWINILTEEIGAGPTNNKNCRRIEMTTMFYLAIPLIPDVFVQQYNLQKNKVKEIELEVEKIELGVEIIKSSY
jgi:hypothetical protein